MDKQNFRMNLPMVSKNEDIETISSNLFKLLFDVSKFEVRPEPQRDKGIDFHIEIKQSKDDNSVYTNFRFAVQLKATESILPNVDGSFSLQIDSSNLNYLLNNSTPAYYVFFHKPTNVFYYESVYDIFNLLQSRNIELDGQEKHTVRFTKLLDSGSIENMHDTAFKRGMLQRRINEKTSKYSLTGNTSNSIVIDSNENIIDDETIRNAIHTVGFELINKSKWKEIIQYHKRGSGNVASTALYNLTLGIAHYHNGEVYDSLKFLKTADRLKSELSVTLNNHLIYFFSTVKLFLGIISEDDFKIVMDSLEKSNDIGLYVKLENAKDNYLNNLNEKGAFDSYRKSINEIIENPNAGHSIKINAKRELLHYEGINDNMDHVRSLSSIIGLQKMGVVTEAERNNYFDKFINKKSLWHEAISSLLEESAALDDYQSYFTSVLTEVKVKYQFTAQSTLLYYAENKIEMRLSIELKEFITLLIEKIQSALKYFNEVGHVENQIATLSLLYELLHFIEDFENAKESLNKMKNLVEIYESKEHVRKLENLIRRGTTHEQFQDFLEETFSHAEKERNDHNENIALMKNMDSSEKEIKKSYDGTYQIHLFPIGSFLFPKQEVNKVFEILNVTPEAQEQFLNIFEFARPIANIHYDVVYEEGPQNGSNAERGPEGWKNIFKVRTAFYENKFYRIPD